MRSGSGASAGDKSSARAWDQYCRCRGLRRGSGGGGGSRLARSHRGLTTCGDDSRGSSGFGRGGRIGCRGTDARAIGRKNAQADGDRSQATEAQTNISLSATGRCNGCCKSDSACGCFARCSRGCSRSRCCGRRGRGRFAGRNAAA